MSFMRDMAERMIINLSPEERREALHDVASLMVERMTPEERAESFRYVMALLAEAGASTEQNTRANVGTIADNRAP